MGNTRSALGDLHLFSKGGVFTSEQLDEYQAINVNNTWKAFASV